MSPTGKDTKGSDFLEGMTSLIGRLTADSCLLSKDLEISKGPLARCCCEEDCPCLIHTHQVGGEG